MNAVWIATQYSKDGHSGRYNDFRTKKEAVQWVKDNIRPEDRCWQICKSCRDSFDPGESWFINKYGAIEHRRNRVLISL